MARLAPKGPEALVFPSRFPARYPNGIAGVTVYEVLKLAREELGIVGPMDMHSLRRMHACRGRGANIPERVSMNQMGHKSVAHHRGYKARARGDDLVAAASAVAAR